MEYQKPRIEILWLDREDIVRTSLTDGGNDDGDDIGGDGKQPWE